MNRLIGSVRQIHEMRYRITHPSFGFLRSAYSYTSNVTLSRLSLRSLSSTKNQTTTTNTSSVMKVFYHPEYNVSLPDGHRFPMERYQKTYQLLQSRIQEETNGNGYSNVSSLLSSSSTVPILTIQDSPLLPKELTYLAHTMDYINAYVSGNLSIDQHKRIGFPWSKEFVQRTLRITGGTVQATLEALNEFRGIGSISGNLAGGTHHAFQDHGEGFCIVNDIAVAIRFIQTLTRYQQQQNLSPSFSKDTVLDPSLDWKMYPSILPVYRTAVLDLDVHQGNGTAGIFAHDSSVITVSMHGERNYPWSTRYPSVYDVDLPDQCTDDIYLASLHDTLRIMDGLIRLTDNDILRLQNENQSYAYQLGLGKEVLMIRNNNGEETEDQGNSTSNTENKMDTVGGGKETIRPSNTLVSPRSLREQALPIIQAPSSRTTNKSMTVSTPSSSSSLASSSSSTLAAVQSFGKSSPLVCTLAQAAVDHYQPIRIQCLFYQAGVDPLQYDRLGRLRLTRTGLHERNDIVYRWAEERNLPVIVTMGGGYSKPIEKSTQCHTDVFLQAAASYQRRKSKYFAT